MRADEVRSEQAKLFEERNGTLSPGLQHELVFARHGAEMGVQADAVLARKLAEPAERLRTEPVRPVGRHATGDAPVGCSVPVLEELLRLLETFIHETRIPATVDAAE